MGNGGSWILGEKESEVVQPKLYLESLPQSGCHGERQSQDNTTDHISTLVF